MRTHWDKHAGAWDGHLPNSALFAELLAIVLDRAGPEPDQVAADLGAGNGFLTLPLLDRCRSVIAVDNSATMLEKLRERAGDDPRLSIAPVTFLEFEPAEPLDIVVSNYALHHLRHPAKHALLDRCFAQLRPGGRIVVSDIMVALTLRPGRSGPLWAKVAKIAKKGPAGFWRIGKNGVRWVIGTGEYPADPSFWTAGLRSAGFTGVGHTPVGRETGVVWGFKPPTAYVSRELVPPK
jgi:SAM-dependent methyltransferase